MTARSAHWRDTCRLMLRNAGPQAPALRSSFSGLLAAAVSQGLALACLFPLFGAVLGQRDTNAALGWLAAMTGLAAVATALRWRAQGFEYNGHLAQTTHALRTRLGRQLRRMPLAALQDRRAGDVHALLLGSVDENLNHTVAIVNLMLQAIVTPAVVALTALAVDWRLGLLLLLFFPVIVPLCRWRRPGFGLVTRELAEAHERTNADIVEYVQGLAVLRAACSEGAGAQTLTEGFRHLEAVQTRAQRRAARPDAVIASVVEVGLLGVVAACAAWVALGTLDLATLAAAAVILVRFSEPLATFVSYTVMLELIETALERIEALLAIQPLPQAVPVASPVTSDVRFEDVSFRHRPTDVPALQTFTAALPARRLTALVGPSGAGKTTLTRLLLRHADPQQGRVTIGGVDLRRIPAEVLAGMVSVVFQDVSLFDDSVLANVLMARPDASEEEVRTALDAARCTEFVRRLPQGWHTALGPQGSRLSGGERQRISIARALLKDAPIVILDEPTAALDAESEVAVQAAISALVRDKTVLVIAHRLSTIAGADQILVLEGGRLAQSGRHPELLATPGRYRTMWEAQQALKPWRSAHGLDAD